MAFVFKIKCGDVLRRVTVPQQQGSPNPDITLIALESKIRDLVGLTHTTKLFITYTDADGDNVMMGNELDLIDACVNQSLNPLRLFITAADDDKALKKPEAGNNEPSSSIDLTNLRGLLPNTAVDGINQLLTTLPSLVVRKAVDESLKALKEAQASVEALDNNKKGKTFSEPNDDGNRVFFPHHNNPSQGPAETVVPNMEECWAHRSVHRNVECDVCGMIPIIGIRYKSLTKKDYDLCSNCFKQIGNSVEYQKIDRPQSDWPFRAARPYPCRPFNARKTMRHNPMHPHPFTSRGPPGFNQESSCQWGPPVNGNAGKLDARFVKDVTIFDGTEMSPMARFTKIWRLRNVGTTAFPSQTHLVHVEGDYLGPVTEVSLQLPEKGLPIDEEIEVSADLISPERPGLYTSYWRLRAPSGQKFGQKMWVTIQVVTPGELSPLMKDSLLDVEQTCGDGSALRDPHDDEMEMNSQGTTAMEIPYKGEPVSATKPGEPLGIPDLPMEEAPLNGGVENNLEWEFISKPVSEKTSEAMESDSLLPEGTSQFHADGNITPPNADSLKQNVEGLIQEACLEQLELMGFTQRSVNLELLQKNNNDLQKTIEDLVTTSEWAPLLHSLEEMGYYDKELNMQLMLKNSGSLKLVVKDLVEMQASAGNNSASSKGKEKSL
jgi:next-to-BRCA1 protein 1